MKNTTKSFFIIEKIQKYWKCPALARTLGVIHTCTLAHFCAQLLNQNIPFAHFTLQNIPHAHFKIQISHLPTSHFKISHLPTSHFKISHLPTSHFKISHLPTSHFKISKYPTCPFQNQNTISHLSALANFNIAHLSTSDSKYPPCPLLKSLFIKPL